jgi:hypothetical protein
MSNDTSGSCHHHHPAGSGAGRGDAKIINQFSLNTPTTKYRFTGGVPDPSGRYYYTIMMTIDKAVDRYKVSKWQYAVIDLAQKKVVKPSTFPTRTIRSTPRAHLPVSPDGKLLYLFRDKVLVLNTLISRSSTHRPGQAGRRGAGAERFRRRRGTAANNDEYVGAQRQRSLYPQQAVRHRHFKLSDKTFTYKPIGPAPYQMAGMQVSPDQAGLHRGDRGHDRQQALRVLKFDLTADTVTDKAEFPAVRASTWACRAMARSCTSTAPRRTSKCMMPPR